MMPRVKNMEISSIAEQLFFTTVRIETENDSESGVGTGTLFNYKSNAQSYPFIVTNKHVVSGAKKGKFTFIKSSNGKPLFGLTVEIDLTDFEDYWYGHSSKDVDIAIMPLGPLLQIIKDRGDEIFYRPINNDVVPSKDTLSKLDAIEDVVFVGYPTGIWDSKNKLPVIRRGITASPLQIDYEAKKQFLVDASVFPGSSGSPVFLYNAGSYHDKEGGLVVGSRLYFLGIIAMVFYISEKNEIQHGAIPTKKSFSISKQMVDLGVVFKTSAILETMDSFLKDCENKDWRDVCSKDSLS